MTPDEQKQVLAAWRAARAAGWRRTSRIAHVREFASSGDALILSLAVEHGDVELQLLDASSALYYGWPTSVAQAVDVLAALDVVPADHSTNYKAGHANGYAERHYEAVTDGA